MIPRLRWWRLPLMLLLQLQLLNWPSVSSFVSSTKRPLRLARWVAEASPPDDTAATAAAESAVRETENWARHFVEPLNLCPWAAASLAEQGAIRYVHTTSATRQDMSRVVEAEAGRLLRRGQSSDAAAAAAAVDPHTAITFIVCPQLYADDFPSFHDLCVWLDEDFLATAAVPEGVQLPDDDDEFEFENDYDGEEESEDWQLGDLVIAAGFHPQWEFGGEDADSAVHWEKRSPCPTVSLVFAEAIDGAEAATAKIGDHNRRVLLELGNDKVQGIYRDVVGRAI